MTATVDAVKPSPNGNGARTFDPAQWQADADRLIGALPEAARGPFGKAIGAALGGLLRDDKPIGYRAQIRTLADAFEARPKLPYLVAGVIPARSLSIIYAPPGQLKTNIGMDLGMSVATGCNWLPSQPPDLAGGMAVTPCPVLWLDIDSGEDVIRERAAAFARAYGANITDTPFYWWTFPTPALSAAKGLDSLAVLLQEKSIGLVVIDNLLRVAGVPDENSSAMDTAMGNIRGLIESTGASVILIHHPRKDTGGGARLGDSLRGHSSIEAAVDLALRVNRDGDVVTFTATKVRRKPIGKFAAVWTYEHDEDGETLNECRFFASETADTLAARAKSEARRQTILDTLTNGKLNFNALFEAVKGTRAELKDDLSAMLLDNLIEVKSGPRNSKIYSVKVATGTDTD